MPTNLLHSNHLQSSNTIDPVTLWSSIYHGCIVLSLLFFTCEIGQQITDKFEEISYEFNQLDWYLFPIKVQQMLPTIMINAQEPFIIGCYGIFFNSREQFKLVNSELNVKSLFDFARLI